MIPVAQDVLSNSLCMDNISYKEQEAEQLCAHKRLMSTFKSLAAICSSVPGFELSLTPEIKSTLFFRVVEDTVAGPMPQLC